MNRFLRGPFSWARAVGVPVAVIVLVFLDAGGLVLFLFGVLAGAAGLFRLAQGIWIVSTHPSPEHRGVGARKTASGALTVAGLCAAFVIFDASFDRARESGRELALRLQAACDAGEVCPQSLGEAGWNEPSAGWIYRFPLLYFPDEAGDGFSLWVRSGIDEGIMYFGGAGRSVQSCSRAQFEVDGCEALFQRPL